MRLGEIRQQKNRKNMNIFTSCNGMKHAPKRDGKFDDFAVDGGILRRGGLLERMSNRQFWTKTNAAALKAVRSAKGKPDTALRRDWKLKQASRSGSHSYVTISEIRTLGTGISRAISS